MEWLQYYEAEPFGTPLVDVVQACQSALLANVNRDSKLKPEPYEFQQFLLFSRSEKPEQSEPVILENGMTVSEFKMFIYLQALAKRANTE